MARMKTLPTDKCFAAAVDAAVATGDDGFCFPLAVALLTDTPMAEALKAFAEAGRGKGKGTPFFVARKACNILGYKLEHAGSDWIGNMIATYPGVHKNLKNITTRHPVRFAKQWEGQNVILHINGHVAAVKDGVMKDWSANRAKHVIAAYKVVKL